MLRPMRFLLCASAAALILGATPVGSILIEPAHAQADVVVSATIAPPPLPIYDQPPIPGPGYVWIPGYWAWDGAEYYWVPGYWVQPPAVGLLWTPGYWAWDAPANDFIFNAGYWGPTVGFYGGIDYGFGYPRTGYYGGYWANNQFYYNRSVNNIGNTNITTVYNRPVPAPTGPSRASFNGGQGVVAKPTAAQEAVARERHVPPTAAQIQHQQVAARDPAMKFGANKGRPPVAAVQRAGEIRARATRAPAEAASGAVAPPHAAAAAAAGAVAAHAAHAVAAPRIARTAPAHAPAAVHAPAPHIAAHAPAPRFAARQVAAMPRFTAPHVAAAPRFRAPRVAAAPRFAAPHAAAMPHFAAPAAPHVSAMPRFAAPAAPHVAAMPHFAPAAPHAAAMPHLAAPPIGAGPRRP